MKYIWILIFLFSQMAWSGKSLEGNVDQPAHKLVEDQLSTLQAQGEQLIQYKQYFCHTRDSSLTVLISSSHSTQRKACEAAGMESGEGFSQISISDLEIHIPPQTPQIINFKKDTDLIIEHIRETIGILRLKTEMEILAETLCKNQENPKECEIEIIGLYREAAIKIFDSKT